MAVLLAAALAYTLSLTPNFVAQAEPYDNAAVETPGEPSAEADPTESLENGLSVDPGMGSPHAYLYASYPRYARRLDCVISNESGWDVGAYNPRSGATGLAQFLLGTWLSTPQGKAGASRTNPIASIDGAVFLIEQTSKSWGHWSVVTSGLC